jgi:hypothetical protein
MRSAILVIVSAASCVVSAGPSPVTAAHRLLQLLRSQPPSVLAVPRTWDEEAMASVELPLASTGVPPEHISSDYYYRMPVRPIYKSYPIYAPGR